MNNFGKMIQSNLISFSNALLTNYFRLGLDEVDAIIIMHLYQQKKDRDDFLSIRSLQSKMTIDQRTLSERIFKLVESGFIELLIEDGQNEQFTLNATIEKLGLCFENEDVQTCDSKKNELIARIVSYTESCYHRTLSPTDLEIIHDWVNDDFSYEEITKAIFDSLKDGRRMQLKYVDAILVSRSQKREEVVIDPKIKEVLDQVYVKRR